MCDVNAQIVEHAAGLRSGQAQPHVIGHAAPAPDSPPAAVPVSATLGLEARARQGQAPPAGDSGAVRSTLRRVFPPALSKASPRHLLGSD